MFYSDHPPQIHTSEPARTTHVTLASANEYLIRACFDTPYGVPGSVQWRSIRLEAEAAHRQIQLFGQLTQGNHRIGYLLRDRIPLSSHAREMLDVRGDVPPALALFTHCDSYRVDTTSRVTDQTRGLLQRALQLAQQLIAAVQGHCACLQGPLYDCRLAFQLERQLVDGICRSRRALRQIAHLIGNHAKASAAFAGTRRLNCRIQCQQIGLRRELLDLIDAGSDGRGADNKIPHRAADGRKGEAYTFNFRQ